MQELNSVLNASLNVLKPQRGTLAAISFHSLEDKIIKKFIKENESGKSSGWTRKNARKIRDQHVSLEEKQEEYTEFIPKLKRINKKVIIPEQDEIDQNPRCRSAKLRLACTVNPKYE